MKPPNTTRIASSGIIAFRPSAEPRLVASVESVSHALKQASFADEPKNVITQSMTITSVTPTLAALAAMGKSEEITSTRSSTKHQMEMPHRM